ncbi:MAG: trypsin-like peptidase domain-containing protein [Clostridia bacterium]|nr:trypsin-like peptidase domain-containing protein [Clostridia bacterium]
MSDYNTEEYNENYNENNEAEQKEPNVDAPTEELKGIEEQASPVQDEEPHYEEATTHIEDAQTPRYKEATAHIEDAQTPQSESVPPIREQMPPRAAQRPDSAPDGEYSFTYRRADEPRREAPRYDRPEGYYSAPRDPYYGRDAYAPGGRYEAPRDPYRAEPQYGQYGGAWQQPGGAYTEYRAPAYQDPRAKKEKQEKKVKRGNKVIKTALALMLVVLCCAGGFLGSWIYMNKAGGNKTVKDTTVMYRSVETKTDSDVTSVEAVAEAVSDSVVEITTEYVTTSYFSFGQYVTKGAGSGVIVSDDGYIVTNNHVISDTENGDKLADKISVRLHNGEEYAAEVIGRDSDADIAVIKIKAEGLTAAVWGDSDAITVGEQVIVVGNPLGKLGGTVTTGIISALSRDITVENTKMTLIQTDAAVNPGNSGGGMFNGKGELIGIVNAKSSGTGIEGLGFAIPSNNASNVAKQLTEYGYVKGKAYLGINFYEATSGGWFTSDSSGILYVYSCVEGYNDDVLQYGDQVIAVDGTAVTTKAEVKAILANHKVGDKLTFSILRQGKTMDVTVTCYEYVPAENSMSIGD